MTLESLETTQQEVSVQETTQEAPTQEATSAEVESNLGNRLKNWRLSQSPVVRQTKLAADLEISQALISLMEKRGYEPKKKAVKDKIEQFLSSVESNQA